MLCVPATCTALTAGTTCSSPSRYQGKVSRIYFRADAALAIPEVYEFLEAERIKYAIRLPANQASGTAITPALAITRCSCSTSLATSNAVLCVPATCTALTAGTTCSSPSRYQGKVSRIYFRADAALAIPEVYEFLEAERIKYAIRLPAN